MCIRNHFNEEIAKEIEEELNRNAGKCHYDEKINKIVYEKAEDAMQEYCSQQIKKIEDYKWLESEKAHHDLGEPISLDWVSKFSEKIRNRWQNTHIFVPELK